MAVIGGVFHYLIAITATAVYYLAKRQLRFLVTQAINLRCPLWHLHLSLHEFCRAAAFSYSFQDVLSAALACGWIANPYVRDRTTDCGGGAQVPKIRNQFDADERDYLRDRTSSAAMAPRR